MVGHCLSCPGFDSRRVTATWRRFDPRKQQYKTLGSRRMWKWPGNREEVQPQCGRSSAPRDRTILGPACSALVWCSHLKLVSRIGPMTCDFDCSAVTPPLYVFARNKQAIMCARLFVWWPFQMSGIWLRGLSQWTLTALLLHSASSFFFLFMSGKSMLLSIRHALLR